MRLCSRRVCSSGPTSSQYFRSTIPESTIAFSNAGRQLEESLCVCSSVQNPITRSTPARLYQLRSKITTSPPAGRWGTYRCTYICDFSRSVGLGSATTRNTRGLTRSVIALIVPPLPALSRPSKTTQILAPDAFTHSCMATSSACSVRSSASYSLLFIFGGFSVGSFPSDRCSRSSWPSCSSCCPSCRSCSLQGLRLGLLELGLTDRALVAQLGEAGDLVGGSARGGDALARTRAWPRPVAAPAAQRAPASCARERSGTRRSRGRARG